MNQYFYVLFAHDPKVPPILIGRLNYDVFGGYVVVEFDNLPKPEQFAFWYSIISKGLLDVAVLLDSGRLICR